MMYPYVELSSKSHHLQRLLDAIERDVQQSSPVNSKDYLVIPREFQTEAVKVFSELCPDVELSCGVKFELHLNHGNSYVLQVKKDNG